MGLVIGRRLDENWAMISRSERNKWFFRAAAIAAALLPFLALEVGLRVFGTLNDQTKLNQGLQPAIPLFTLNEEIRRYRTSLSYQQFFAEVSFQPKQTRQRSEAESANAEKLIFVLGGSTVQGRPFAPETAFPAWAEDYLNDSSESERIRIVNCGGVSFASDRLSRLVPELLSYEPDMIVIATGHNEFLEDHTYSRSRSTSSGSGFGSGFTRLISESKTVALIRSLIRSDAIRNVSAEVPVVNHDVNARLDNKAGYETYHYDADWHVHVVSQFCESLSRMIDQCEAARVPVCLIELAANHRDCAPLKSEHAPSVLENERTAWRASMDHAEVAIDGLDWAAAISSLKDCVAQSPEHALSHFRLARCLKADQQFQAASRHFQLAVDFDICPLRMKTELVESLRRVAKDRSVSLIKCEELLMPVLEDGCTEFGFELFLDHVHPTVRGHQMIGRKLAETIQALGVAEATDLMERSASSRMFERRIAECPAVYFNNGRRRIGWLENWARAQKTSNEILPMTVADLTQRIRRQLELRDDTLVSQLASVLVKTRDGNQRLIELAEDFRQSGQLQPATAILRHATQTELLERPSGQLETLPVQQRVEADESVEVRITPRSVDPLLSDAEGSLIRDILEHGQN